MTPQRSKREPTGGGGGPRMETTTKRPALGKGLSALIPDAPEPRVAPLEVDIDRLSPNAFQPRAQMDDARLDELAQSIKSNGVIQPIVVRKAGDRFQIIAGERRWRAAQKAGLLRVPVVVRDVAAGQERSLLEMALIENIQRENLNPIDEALAYRRLSDEFQSDAGRHRDRGRKGPRHGRQLPAPAQAARGSSAPRWRRARCRWAMPARCWRSPTEADQRRVARDVIARSLSVRETESLVKKIVDEGRSHAETPAPGREAGRRPHARGRGPAAPALGTRVRIVRQGTEGPDRNRFRVRRRADPDLRPAHGEGSRC